MDVGWFYKILIITALLIISAFFSGSEVALFSLDKKKVKDLKKDHGLFNRYIFLLLEYPRRLLVTILLGNTVVNVAASIIAVTLALDIAKAFDYSPEIVLLVQIVVLTLLVLIIGEVTPKLWANKYPFQFSKIVAMPLYWIGVLIYPVAKILTDVLKFFVEKVDYDKFKTAILTSELGDLADLGIEKGTIEEEEHELIHGLVSFKTISAREVMTPRVDISAIPSDADFDEMMNIITESGHSRLPLYENSLDKIIGIIYAKDLLPFLANTDHRNNLDLKKISREAMFVPESKLINELMHEFQAKNMHVGIVVDEYGGTAGLISLEDILEEIVGEIRDEYDQEENEIIKLNDTSYMIMGKVPIDELNELLNEDFSSENDDYDTVGGFIFNHAGTIPDENFSFTVNNYSFTVKEIVNKRINKVLVEKVQTDTIPS